MATKLRSSSARFTAETVALFRELNSTPARHRHRAEFKAREKELALMLDLTAEYWTTNSVLDRRREPCWPPGLIARDDWFRCRSVREQLLLTASKTETA
jgi:hypothetical protein